MPAEERFGSLLVSLRQLVGAPCAASDGQLLQTFLQQGSQDAFATLVARHGAMVLGVGRRVLGSHHDAEEVVQATFLVLAKNARAIRKQPSVASWLHGVAYRLALKARTRFARLRARERGAGCQPVAAEPDLAWRELQTVLDEELQRLPEKYRRPLLLCYFEDRSHEEAAAALAWPIGTLKTRVAKAKELLRVGLTGRGITLSAAALTTALAAQGTTAAGGALVQQILHAATLLRQGQMLTGAVSPSVIELIESAAVMSGKTKLAALALAALACIFAVSAAARPQPAAPGDEPAALAAAPHPPQPPQDVPAIPVAALDPADDPKDLEALPDCHRKMLGVWHLAASEKSGLRVAAPAPLELRFTKDRVVWTSGGKTKRLTYTVDPSVLPKTVDLAEADGSILRGIYDHKEGHFWLCFAEPGGPRPKSFATTAPAAQQMLLLAKAPPILEEVAGLRASITAPAEIAADRPELLVQLQVMNVSAQPLRVCRWVERAEHDTADYDIHVSAIDRADQEALGRSMLLLQPGEYTYWDVAVIPSAAFRERDEITLTARYTLADPSVVSKHQTWSGSVQARPQIVRVQRPPRVKETPRTATIKPALTFGFPEHRPTSIASSADGRWLAVALERRVRGGADCIVQVRNLATGAVAAAHETPWFHVGPVALSPDGKLLAAIGGGGYVSNQLVVWETLTGKKVMSATTDGECGRLAFTPDARTLAAVAEHTETPVECWDVATGRRTLTVSAGRRGGVALSADGRTIVAFDEKLGLIDVAAQKPWTGPAASLTWLGSTSVAPDGRSQVVAVHDWLPLPARPWAEKRWTLQRRGVASAVPSWTAPADQRFAAVFAPHGQWLVQPARFVVRGIEQRTLTLHDAATGRALITQPLGADESFAGFTAAPVRLATTTRDAVRLWDVVLGDAPPLPSAYGYPAPPPAYPAPKKK